MSSGFTWFLTSVFAIDSASEAAPAIRSQTLRLPRPVIEPAEVMWSVLRLFPLRHSDAFNMLSNIGCSYQLEEKLTDLLNSCSLKRRPVMSKKLTSVDLYNDGSGFVLDFGHRR